MEVKPEDGSVLKFTSLDLIGWSYDDPAEYTTYGAIYHDISDVDDGKSYYYTSFIMDEAMIVAKINSETAIVSYSYTYQDDDSTDTYKNMNIPNFLH